MKKQLEDYNLQEARSYVSYLQRQYAKALDVMIAKSPVKKDREEIVKFLESTFDNVDSWML